MNDLDLKQKALKGYLSLSSSRIIQGIIGFLTMVLSLRYFGPELIGIFAVGYSIYNFLVGLNLGTSPALQAFLSDYEERTWKSSIRKMIHIAFFLRSLFFVMVALILFYENEYIASFFGMPALATVLLLFALKAIVSIANGPFDVHTMLGLRLYKGIFCYYVVFSLGNATAVVVTVLTSGTLENYVTYFAFSGVPAAAVSWYFYWKHRGKFSGSPRDDEPPLLELVGRLVRFSIPTTLNQVLAQIHFHAANLISAKFLGASATGYISFATGFINRLDDLIKPMATVMLPVFSKLKTRNSDQLAHTFEQSNKYSVYLSFLLTAILVGFAKQITLLMGGASFLPAVIPLQIISAQMLFRIPIHPMVSFNYSLQYPHINMGLHFVKITLELFLYLIFVPYLGISGLALAILVAWTTALVMFDCQVRYLLYGSSCMESFLPEMGRYAGRSAVIGTLFLYSWWLNNSFWLLSGQVLAVAGVTWFTEKQLQLLRKKRISEFLKLIRPA